MPRNRALRTLNVNPGTVPKPTELKTTNAAFSCTENDPADNKCTLERSLKNAQLFKENKLLKQLGQAAALEQETASTSRFDSPLVLFDDSTAEEHEDSDFLPTGICLGASSDVGESSTENASEVSGPLASSSNDFVTDLHKKLCDSQKQNKRRSKRICSQISNTLPVLNADVNNPLPLETDFDLPSTSSTETTNNSTTAVRGRKRGSTQKKRTLPKRSQTIEKEMGNSATNLPSTSVCDLSVIPVVSDSEDSDIEITGYVPSYSQRALLQMELPPPVCPSRLISHLQKNAGVSGGVNVRLGSIINTLNAAVQRLHQGHGNLNITTEDAISVNRSVIEVLKDEVNRNTNMTEVIPIQENQLAPTVIEVSDDESETTVKPASSKQSSIIATEMPPQKKTWECPICWEELTSMRGVSATMCGHVFCAPCITNVLKSTKKCPMCRKTLNSKKVHPLFLDDR